VNETSDGVAVMIIHLFRRPDVPGFCPSNGLVGISFTDMADRRESERLGLLQIAAKTDLYRPATRDRTIVWFF